MFVLFKIFVLSCLSNKKRTNLLVQLNLTVGFNLTVTAAVKKLSVVSPGTATGSVSIKSFEWKSVWVSATARFFTGNTFDSRFDWATFVMAGIETLVVTVAVVIDLGSGKKKSEKTVNELAFNSASVSGTVVVVQGVARVS